VGSLPCQATHRHGTAPALGLRAGIWVAETIERQTDLERENPAMTPRLRNKSTLRLEQLEDRCTPTSLSFITPLGEGSAAVSLAVTIQYPAITTEPCFVSVQQVLPNGNINLTPTDPCTPQTFANVPLHDFIPPGALRGLLQSAGVNSSAFIVPGGHGG
jgi:hypothetical protein